MRTTKQLAFLLKLLLPKRLASSFQTIFHLGAITLLLFLNSCVPLEQLIYLQESDVPQDSLLVASQEPYTLRANDILDVKILSMNPEMNDMFNSPSQSTFQGVQATAQNGGDLFYLTGYSIDPDGNIDLPFVGSIHVAGQTVPQAYVTIDSTVATLFSNYHLTVRLGGIRFSTLGEVNRPGKYVAMQNQLTIFDALAMSGDLTTVSNRAQIKVLRQGATQLELFSLNLLERSTVSSPCFYILPNDVIYVEPLKQKSWGFGITGADSFSTVLGSVSTSLALILSIISLSR